MLKKHLIARFAGLVLVLVVFTFIACKGGETTPSKTAGDPKLQADAQKFIDDYTAKFVPLYYKQGEAEWLANTDISDEHDKAKIEADKEYSKFVGDKTIITAARNFLSKKDELTDLQRRQIKAIWILATDYPGTIPDKVTALIEAETKQNSDLYGFEFKVKKDGKEVPITANEIVDKLISSRDINERLAVWESSKEVGKVLRDGLHNLQTLRNTMAREMGYKSYFSFMTDNYGMSGDELAKLMDQVVEEIKPLYIELHTYARYELAKRYNQPVPDYLPAHWVGNRWGQSWPGLVESVDLDHLLKDKTAPWMVERAEAFYMSMGFPKLNDTFWQKSDLYPATGGRKKNTHASAWHLDLGEDYRSLMSVENDFEWFTTVHHELGHIYYYIAYTNPEVPVLLREGANRAFHEGMGTLISLASSQRPYLEGVGLLGKDVPIDNIQWLLDQAMEYVVFLPWSAGTMTHFEHDLYDNDLSPSEYNKRWWEYTKKYQGIVPPSERGEEYTDAATKTHINDDPAGYYDYAISSLILFQLHNHIAKNILHQDPTSCNYVGNKEVGDFLRSIMKVGSTKDWQQVMKETTGETLNAKAINEYFAPLMEYLKKANEGRVKTVL